MEKVLDILGRKSEIFDQDIKKNEKRISNEIKSSSFLVVGAGGSIGQAVTKEIFSRNPSKLHAVDINENSLVELVRDLRSSAGYISGDFRTFALDCGSSEFENMFKFEGPYDYVLNLSALKHVRSERDPWTLMRLIEVNILNTLKTIDLSIEHGTKKYFCVSTDKASNPVNLMGASKRLMEIYLEKKGNKIDISTARFANVAFSDGSLLDGVRKRINKGQPVAGPNDISRYFMTSKEAGKLCLLSTIIGKNREIFFPQTEGKLSLMSFQEIISNYLNSLGISPIFCNSEEEARQFSRTGENADYWPCFFTESDTTGEKKTEEFFAEKEEVDLGAFHDVGIILNNSVVDKNLLDEFIKEIKVLKANGVWNRDQLITLFNKTIPNFNHIEKNSFLDQKM